MTGKYHISVTSKKLRYELCIQRNITVITGDSGSGKTALVQMILRARRKNSPFHVICDKQCYGFTVDTFDEFTDLTRYEDAILFFDEDVEFIRTREFASIVKKSNCYFVLVSREVLKELPYSCSEIYKLEKGRVLEDGALVNDMHVLYNINYRPKINLQGILSCIIVEDKKAGYQFFKMLADRENIVCISAEGNSNICKVYEEQVAKKKESGILIIVDGAAFGAYYQATRDKMRQFYNTVIYLPESFEWILLRSSLLYSQIEKDRILKPYLYAESTKFMSWEQYFTKLIYEITKGTDLQYSKDQLNRNYCTREAVESIRAVIPVLMLTAIVPQYFANGKRINLDCRKCILVI